MPEDSKSSNKKQPDGGASLSKKKNTKVKKRVKKQKPRTDKKETDSTLIGVRRNMDFMPKIRPVEPYDPKRDEPKGYSFIYLVEKIKEILNFDKPKLLKFRKAAEFTNEEFQENEKRFVSSKLIKKKVWDLKINLAFPYTEFPLSLEINC